MSAEHTPPANTGAEEAFERWFVPINAAAQETTDDEVRRSGHEGFISPAAAPNEPVAPSADEVRELADKWANTLIHLNGPTATDENRRERLDAATEAYYVFNRALKRLAERASLQAESAQPPPGSAVAEVVLQNGFKTVRFNVHGLAVGAKLYASPPGSVPLAPVPSTLAKSLAKRLDALRMVLEMEHRWAPVVKRESINALRQTIHALGAEPNRVGVVVQHQHGKEAEIFNIGNLPGGTSLYAHPLEAPADSKSSSVDLTERDGKAVQRPIGTTER
jgi:hypothetical protein